MNKIALFGGVYSNHFALSELLSRLKTDTVDAVYCLGDLGGFGPSPDKVFPMLQKEEVRVVQGNYDHSIGNDLPDCQCGYTDPADNYFARLSYEYTWRHTSQENKRWMRDLPTMIRLNIGGKRVLLCHGSPRRTNEFLWESSTSTAFLERLCSAYDADVIVTTHTGLHWQRKLSGDRLFVNCGVIGRPANDGRRNVWLTFLELRHGEVHARFEPLEYDWQALAAEMRSEALPEQFIETVETGYWTTCLEVLPVKERSAGIY